MGRPAEAGDRPDADALGDVVDRQRRHRRHQPLAQHQHGAALADLVGDLADRGGQRLGGHGEADEVEPGELDVGGALDDDARRQLDAVEIALVGAGGDDLVGLLLRAAAELHLQATARQQHGDGRPPGAGADHGGAAQRRQATEPLPLQLDRRPDAVADGVGEGGRGALGTREGQRRADPQFDLAGEDEPAVADVLGPLHGDRQHGRARLQRQPTGAAARPAERAGPDPRPLGKDDDGAAPVQDVARRDQDLLVGLAAAHRVGAEPVEQPALPTALEELDLGDELQAAAPGQRHADHEGVEEGAVVGGDDQRPLDLGVLAPVAGEAQIQVERRLQNQPRQVIDQAVRAALARIAVISEQPLARNNFLGHIGCYTPRPHGLPVPAWVAANLELFRAGVAQLVEQLSCKQQVPGSSPGSGSDDRSAKRRAPRRPQKRPAPFRRPSN